MIQPLVVASAIVKLAFSVALTYRTRWWWAPGIVTFAIGVALVAASAWTYGLAGIALGTFALAVAGVVRPSSTAITAVAAPFRSGAMPRARGLRV